MQKVTLNMRVSVHPTKAKLWRQRAKIRPAMSLREIGMLINVESPQIIKHHLEGLVSMGSIDKVKGQYVFPKRW